VCPRVQQGSRDRVLESRSWDMVADACLCGILGEEAARIFEVVLTRRGDRNRAKDG
jgi:hypothetical protein